METESLEQQKFEGLTSSVKHQREGDTSAPQDITSLAQNSDEEFSRIKRSKLDTAKVDRDNATADLLDSEHATSALGQQQVKVAEAASQGTDSATKMPGTEEAGEPGLHALYNANFDEDYNEESDEDWDENDSGSGDDGSSDDDDDEIHEKFLMGVNHKYNELEGNSGDEEEDAGM